MWYFCMEKKKKSANETWWNTVLHVPILDEKNTSPVTLFCNYGCGYFRLKFKKKKCSFMSHLKILRYTEVMNYKHFNIYCTPAIINYKSIYNLNILMCLPFRLNLEDLIQEKKIFLLLFYPLKPRVIHDIEKEVLIFIISSMKNLYITFKIPFFFFLNWS